MVNKIFALFLMLLPVSVQAFDVVELKEVKIDYYDFFHKGREPLVTANGLPNRSLGREIQLHVNSDVFEYLYWHNRVHTFTDEIGTSGKGQFRTVGWELKLGVRVFPFLNLEFKHHSQHLLDHKLKSGFPVNDSVGINIFLYSHDREKSIF